MGGSLRGRLARFTRSGQKFLAEWSHMHNMPELEPALSRDVSNVSVLVYESDPFTYAFVDFQIQHSGSSQMFKSSVSPVMSIV